MSQPWYSPGSPTSYTPGNIDLATQQAALDRKRQMLQAMMLQAMQSGGGTQMAGNIAIRNSALSPLANMLQSMGAQRGMGKLDDQERELIQRKQQQAADAVTELMNRAQPQAGTPTTVTEQPGPPDVNGVGSYSVEQGKPGGFDLPGFSKAYAGAQYAGVDPQVLSGMLQQFNRGRLLTQMGFGNMVPGAEQQQPTMTPGNANGGARMTLPVGIGAGGAGGASGNFGGVPAQAAALMISGDPALEKLAAAMNEQAKPISARPGAGIFGRDAHGNIVQQAFSPSVDKGQTVDPQGRVSVSPGYIDAATQINKAEAPFKQPLENVPMESGGTYPVRRDLVPPLGAPPGSMVNPPGGKVPPQAMAAANSGRAATLQAELADVSAAPPSAQRDRDIAAINQELRRFGPQSTLAKEEAATTGKYLGEQAQAVDTEAHAAQVIQSRVTEMRPLLDMFDPNLAGPVRLKLGEAALAAGMDKTTADKIAGGDVGAQQAFVKQSIQMAFDATKQLTNRPAASEVLLQIKANPNIGMTKPAMQAILDYTEGVAKWQTERQQLKDAWIEQKGSYRGFEGWFNRNHPIDGYVPSAEQLRSTLQKGQQQPAQASSGAAPMRAVNPKTGETIELRNGQWVPVK
jgi:hypothetical protein